MRTRLISLMAGGMLLPGLLAAAGPAAAGAAPTGRPAVPTSAVESDSRVTWTVHPLVPAKGELTAVTASPNSVDIVAFGIDPSVGRTYAYGWVAEGPSGWPVRRVDVPDVGRVLDADTGFALGERGALRHVDGVWQRTPIATAPGVRTRLTQVAATFDGAWAVGVETAGTGISRGAVQRWDGTSWRRVPVPANVLGPRSALTAVTVAAHPTVFGIEQGPQGERAVVLRYDGTTWKRIAVPSRPGHVDHLITATYRDVAGWSAPKGAAPTARRPVAYTMDGETGALKPAPVPFPRFGEITAVTSDYGVPLAVGNSASRVPFGLRSSFIDGGYGPWRRDEMASLRGRVSATEGTIQGNLWAVGYQQDGDTRRPLVMFYGDSSAPE